MNLSILLFASVFLLLIARLRVVTVLQLRRQTSTSTRSGLIGIWFWVSLVWPVLFKAVLGSVLALYLPVSGSAVFVISYVPSIVIGIAIFIVALGSRDSFPYVPAILVMAVVIMPILIFGVVDIGVVGAIFMIVPTLLWCRALSVDVLNWPRLCYQGLLVLCLSMAVVFVVWPEAVVETCRLDKCTVAGQVLTSSITGNGNFLGLCVALLSVIAVYRQHWITVAAVGLASLIVIEISGSRTAMIGLVLGYLVVLGIGNRMSRVVALAAAMVALVISFVPVFRVYGLRDYTYRGALWMRAKELISESPNVGHGANYWTEHNAYRFSSNYAAHNIWLELGVAVGFFGIAVLVVAAVWALLTTDVENRYLASALIVTTVAVGFLEAPIQPYRTGLLPFLCPLILLLCSSGMRKRSVDTSETEDLAMKAIRNQNVLAGLTRDGAR